MDALERLCRVGNTGWIRRQSAVVLISDEGRRERWERWTNLERRKHLAFLLAVRQVVVVLHRDEGRETVGDRVVCARVLVIISRPAETRAYFASRGLVSVGSVDERIDI